MLGLHTEHFQFIVIIIIITKITNIAGWLFFIPRHSPLTRQPYASATDVLFAGLLELVSKNAIRTTNDTKQAKKKAQIRIDEGNA